MNIGTRITSYAVLPLCILALSLLPGNAAAASVAAPLNPIPARFLTVLPDCHTFAFAQQAAPDSGKKAEQDPLPDGKGKDVTKKICTGCHSVDMFATQRHTREEWSSVIDNMIAKGLDATDDQVETINTYLATYLGPASKKDSSADSNK
jgi:cytochrome c5